MTANLARRGAPADQARMATIRARQAARAAALDRGAIWLAGVLLVLTLLYVLIGPTPYQHAVNLDPLTGAAVMSPINRYIWLGLLALSLPVLWVRRAALPAMALYIAPLLLLLGWFVLTTRWALDPAASNRRLLLYLINTIICVAISVGLKDMRRLHLGIGVACAIVIAIDLASWIVAPGVSMTDLGLAAIHSHKNTLGAVMLLAGFATGTLAWSSPEWRGKTFWWTVTAGAVVLLVASLSKTSLGVFFVLVAATPVLLALLKQRVAVQLGLVFGGLAVIAAVVFGWLAWNGVTGGDAYAPFKGITFTQRTDVWAFVWEQFVQHPIRGLGFGSFWDIDPRVQPSLQTDAWFAQPDAFTNEAHNGYLDLAVTTGVIGLAGAVIVLVRWIVRGMGLIRASALRPPSVDRRTMLGAALLLGVFPLMVFGHNFMESSYFTANSIFGTVILMLGIEIDRQYNAIKR